MNTYPTLPGSSLLHPFPIFSYRGLYTDNVKELKSTSLTYNEAVNARYLCSNTSDNKLENEVETLPLNITDNASIPQNKNIPQKKIQTPTKYQPTTFRHYPCDK